MEGFFASKEWLQTFAHLALRKVRGHTLASLRYVSVLARCGPRVVQALLRSWTDRICKKDISVIYWFKKITIFHQSVRFANRIGWFWMICIHTKSYWNQQDCRRKPQTHGSAKKLVRTREGLHFKSFTYIWNPLMHEKNHNFLLSTYSFQTIHSSHFKRCTSVQWCFLSFYY